MSIRILKQIERFGKDKIYKRWLEDNNVVIEMHVTLVRKRGNFEHDIIRYDLDKEGSHIHIKLFEFPNLSLIDAQKVIKGFDKYSQDIINRLKEEVNKYGAGGSF
jgi:hypothetical protein